MKTGIPNKQRAKRVAFATTMQMSLPASYEASIKRNLDMEETRQWLDDLTHASNNEASQDMVATACMLYQGFQTWPSRSKGITLAKLRRKFKSVKIHEANAFFDSHVFLRPEHVYRTALERYPQSLIAEFLDVPESNSGKKDDCWPLVSILWHRCRASGLFNPVNLKLLFSFQNEVDLIDWPLPDPRVIFSHLRATPKQKDTKPSVVTELTFRVGGNQKDFLQSLRAHGPEIEKLRLDSTDVLQEPGITEVSLSNLRELFLKTLDPLRDPNLGPWLANLPSLRVLRSGFPYNAEGIPLVLSSTVW